MTGATSHLETLTHVYLKDLLWRSNLVLLGIVLCSFMSFTLQIEHWWWSGKVTPFSFWPWRVGSRVSQLTQLLPWCWWDVGPAVLVFFELGLPIFRQNTHIPDVKEDFTFCQLVPHSQELPVSLYFSDFLASCLPWTCVSICGAITASFSLFPLPAAALFIAQFHPSSL